MIATEVSPAAAATLATRRRWRVAHSFTRAAYVVAGDEVVHLVAPGAPFGPLSARAAHWQPLEPGEHVDVEAGAARVRAPRFAPPASLPAVLAALPPALPGLDDLPAAARRLAGTGPGLTPAGDDVLSGFLLALALTGGDAPAALRTIEHALVATTPIARAYVRAAARGGCPEPLAPMLAAALRGERRPLLPRTWGETSGAALVSGFAAGVSRRAEGAWAAPPTATARRPSPSEPSRSP